MRFYNREKEIEILNNLKGDFRVAIVGRRRIGKTRLVEEHYKKNCLTLFISAEKSEKEIINGWIDEYKDIYLVKVDTFKDFFEYLFTKLKDKIIFIDEIQNILKVNKSFLFDLQRLIDKHKPRLIVTGSLIRTMKKTVENYKSPLFGRFDMVLRLKELDFPTTVKICKDLNIDFETSIRLYSVFGGIPKYYELLEKLKKFEFEKFIPDMFIYSPRPLYEEVRTMLKEEFGKEQRMFFSIISAISQGNTKLSEIANFVGKKPTEITKYLHLLRNDFEIITREEPITGGKRGIYKIDTNLVDFWFSNIWRYQELLEKKDDEKAANILKNNLNSWTGKKFENIILDLLRGKIIKSPFDFTEISRWWGNYRDENNVRKELEIDILALNKKTKEILFGECKWKDEVSAEKICKELKEKSKHVQWNNDKRNESYAVFAKSFKKKINKFEDKKVYCFDLKDLEKALIK
ncbi:MAG: ATP-binding protein [Nanoarchaeota archaeon]|nr:ATP-binding protein [Nanoarchaeota archaeon]